VNITSLRLLPGLLVLAGWLVFVPTSLAQESRDWWSPEVGKALDRAGDNRPQLLQALRTTPPLQRPGMAFLVVNMPERDLRSLGGDFLRENVELAYRARQRLTWGARIPEQIFLNDVLPYANVDEERHPWRKQLFNLCLPLIKDCKTPAEAAQKLNAVLFPKLKVRYSTARKKPHQSPKESIDQGLATCTGLSILLADACRSVAVPARLVGTPLWSNGSGNHTWVEVWDGRWHFTGAAEPDANGLDHAWFIGNAAQARADSPEHAIYAASFRRTGLTFPLVWAPESKEVHAENVTARYSRPAKTPAGKPGLSAEQLQKIEKAAGEFFAADPNKQAQWRFDAALEGLLLVNEPDVRRAVWKAYQAAPIHEDLKKDFSQRQVRHQNHLSSYTVKTVGKRPANGWPLFIALHGGGGAPKKVNDDQWRVMQIYYKDQPSVPGYLYLALRAPNDTWNGFYDDYVPPLITNLIRQFVVFGDVDSDKVYLMGYSHGGYGAFFVGPKIPDRFAAVHSSAAAPTDGTISPKNLRNTRFTFMIGEQDNAYGRRQRCEAFNDAIRKLKDKDREGYPVEMELKKGHGHVGLPDREKILQLYPFTRNPVPHRLSWEQTDGYIRHHFWLSVPRPARGQQLDATLKDNTVRIACHAVQRFDLFLDRRLVDCNRPVRISVDSKEQVVTVHPRLLILCQSMLERGDPNLAFTCRVELTAGK
jgi:predicted esterase